MDLIIIVIQKWLGSIICWLLKIVFLLYLSFHSFPKETDYPNVVNSYLFTFWILMVTRGSRDC